MQSTVGQKNTYGRGQSGQRNQTNPKDKHKSKSDDQGQLKKKKKSFKVINYQATVGGYPLKGFEAAACDSCSCSRFYTAWMHSEPVPDASQVPFSSCLTWTFSRSTHSRMRNTDKTIVSHCWKFAKRENWRKTFSWYTEQQKYNVYAVLNRNQRRFSILLTSFLFLLMGMWEMGK